MQHEKKNKEGEVKLKMEPVGGRSQRAEGAGGFGGGASVCSGLAAERRQRGGEHQHLGLHEGEVGQTADHFGRLLAQVLLFPRLPVKQEVENNLRT